MRIFYTRILLVLLISMATQGGYCQEEKSMLKDTLDNAIDLSSWLLELNGFIPVFVPVTEPALGYGAVAAGIYFIPKKKVRDKFIMPDIVAGGAGLTANGSWFGGAAYSGFWKEDHIRYRGIAGYGSINLKYYGLVNELPFTFTINSIFFLQQALFKIKESNFMIGGKYLFGNTKITGIDEDLNVGIDPGDLDLVNSGIGLIAEFENFNNVLSPTKGLRVQLSYSQFMEWLGSDKNNGRATLFAIGYIPIHTKWNIGLRIESNYATEKTPFYMKPYLSMRGLPVLRYQGDWTLLGETEQFMNIYRRWSLVAFGGYGITRNLNSQFQKESSAWNAGSGFRYLIARALKLQMGLDVAKGPEDWAFYVVFGNSWLK